uniref:Uncharacterized protein n=1 Tax=Arundo donax TaxID=35708 RepID=A0A0A8XX29_ARUDO
MAYEIQKVNWRRKFDNPNLRSHASNQRYNLILDRINANR